MKKIFTSQKDINSIREEPFFIPRIQKISRLRNQVGIALYYILSQFHNDETTHIQIPYFVFDYGYVREEIGEHADYYISIMKDISFQMQILPVLQDVQQESGINIMDDGIVDFVDLHVHRGSGNIDEWKLYADELIELYKAVPSLESILRRNGYYPEEIL